MTDGDPKKTDNFEERSRRLERENKRLRRVAKRYETQLQQLDKMAKANEKININLYKELEVLTEQAKKQAREAQIEAALERVRTRAMAMTSTDDLADAIAVVFREVGKLGITTIRCGITIIDAANKTMDVWIATTTEKGQEAKASGGLKIAGNPSLKKVFDAWKRGDAFLSYKLTGQALERYYKSISHDLPLPAREAYHRKQVVSLFFFAEGALYTYTAEPLSAEASQVFEKFTRVFALTYRRYLDLKQAEAQAREAQIEATLERIRNRTLLMKDSRELNEAVAVFFQQFKSLNLLPAEARTYFCHIDTGTHTAEVWMTHADGTVMQGSHFTPLNQSPSLKKFYQAWKRKQPIHVRNYSGEALIEYLQFVSTLPHVKTDRDYRRLFKSPPERIVMTDANFLQGCIGIMTFEALSQEALNILVRFAKVFEFTYTRFLDLQKAEAQAREAQIEAALERVRARTMAMHSSHELQEVITVMFEQLKSLDFLLDVCALDLIEAGSKDLNAWVASPQQIYVQQGRVPYFNHPFINALVRARKKPGSITKVRLLKPEVRSWYKHVISNSPFGNLMSAERKRVLMNAERLDLTFAIAKQTGLIIGNFGAHEYTGVENRTALRFSQVFEQTYRRFLDLQQAEAQAREAQIEAALERVRARTMAMHKSEELHEVIMVVFEQLQSLNLDVEAGFINLHLKESRDHHHLWVAATGQRYAKRLNLPYFDHPYFTRYEEAVANGESLLSDTMTNEDTCRWADHFVEHAEFPVSEERLRYVKSSKGIARSTVLSRDTSMTVWNYKAIPYTADENDIIKRFARVFEQTYTRFLDLKKAEAQAREAQIEAALERVRAKAMGMHTTEDLSSTISILFQELKGLNITAMRCGVGLIDGETRLAEILTSTTTTDGDVLELVGKIKLEGHRVTEGIFQHWECQEEYHPLLQGEELKSYYQLLRPRLAVPDWQDDFAHHGHFFPFPEGCLYAWTEEALAEDALRVFRKFASVLGLTYRRHIDLKQAEARAREAERQASVDRVRAEIASMRTADDLNRITPVIWRELTTVGVPFFRCGVFIMDEATEYVHAYLSTPSGESLAALKLKFDSLPMIEQNVGHWREGKVYRDEWDREQFVEYMQAIMSQGLIDSPKQYQGGEEAPENLALQFVPFTQGMLYVGSASPLSDDEVDLMQMLADAFAVAYARYEDFQRLEAAKAEVEAALKELGLMSQELEVRNAELETENQRKARELEEARRLQLSMLPKKLPSLPDLEIAVYMKTATEVGGDYYDFHVADDGTLTAVVGDATGHGLKAGTMVTVAKSLFSSLAREPDIVSTFSAMSTSIKSMKLPLLSMCLVMLKIKDGEMKVSSAGIPPALVYRRSRKSVEEVAISGMPLGAMKGFPYRQKGVALESGDTILLMTDGFPERMNEKEEMLDYKRAEAAFEEVAAQPPKKIVDHLVKSCDEWANGRPQDDDVTFVVIKCVAETS